MVDFKDKLSDFIIDSDLEGGQKKLWQIFVKAAVPEEAEAVYEAVTEEEGNLALLTKYLKDKVREMKERDEAKWARIVGGDSEMA